MTKLLERTAVVKPVEPVSPISKEELEMAAYFHWLNRGCPANDDLADWIEAEKECTAQSVKSYKRFENS